MQISDAKAGADVRNATLRLFVAVFEALAFDMTNFVQLLGLEGRGT